MKTSASGLLEAVDRGVKLWPASPLDAPPRGTPGGPLFAALGAAAVHALPIAVALLAVAGAHELPTSAPLMALVEVELPPPPPKEPEPPPPEDPPPPPRTQAPAAPKAAPPPAAAQAAQVLEAAPDVVDFATTFVSGTGRAYAGGATDSQGTSTRPVRDVFASGAGRTSSPKAAVPARDLSRSPRLGGGAQWDCPFPSEADVASVDTATVKLRVEVSAAGRVMKVSAATDPGFGFAREARRCAQSKHWDPGLDADGKAIGSVAFVTVRFRR